MFSQSSCLKWMNISLRYDYEARQQNMVFQGFQHLSKTPAFHYSYVTKSHNLLPTFREYHQSLPNFNWKTQEA